MRRSIPILLALALLFLAGCDSSGTEEERGVDTKRSFFHSNQRIYAAETADTIYLGSSDQYIKYVDKATGIGGVLCGKPECGHDGKDCNAWVYGGVKCLFVEGGRLYWIGEHYPREIRQPYSLFSTALDGTDRRELRIPYELDFNGAMNSLMYVENGHLYVSIIRQSIEDGSEVLYQKIEALDLKGDTGQKTVLDERVEIGSSGVSMQFYDGWLYFMTCEGPRETGTYRIRIRRYNAATGEPETLYDEPDSVGMGALKDIWVDDQGVLFMAYDDDTGKMGIYRYGFADGHLEPVCDTGVTGTFRGGIADGIISGFTFQENNGISSFHVVIKDFDGQELLDETYGFDLAETGRALMDDAYGAGTWKTEDMHWNYVSGDMLGRDETNAYYALDAAYAPNNIQKSHITTVIQVPLDGSGAKALCSLVESQG